MSAVRYPELIRLPGTGMGAAEVNELQTHRQGTLPSLLQERWIDAHQYQRPSSIYAPSIKIKPPRISGAVVGAGKQLWALWSSKL